MKNKTNQKFVKLVAISIFIIFLATSATSTMIKTRVNSGDESSSPPIASFYENYYEWKDDFNNEQLIDSSQSYNYIVSNGEAKIKDTYEIWMDPEWTRMKPITVTCSSNYENLAINFEVYYDSDMKSDYGDVRFKHEDYPSAFLPYWLEDYDSNSASFWVFIESIDQGTSKMYMFYGNPNANDESDFGAVFTDWDELWANDEQISYKMDEEGCWDPDVSYGGSKFLVCWEEGQPYWALHGLLGFKQEIRASIYEPDNQDPVVFDKEVFTDDGWTYYHNEDPSIAYGGGKWLVAWEHWAPTNVPWNPQPITTMDIKARTVQKSGSGLSLGSVIEVCNYDNCQADPNVEFDSENSRFMIVWEDGRDGGGDYDIRARLYSTSGSPIGNEKLLDGSANAQCEPWAAYDPGNEQYFIVWEEGIDAQTGPFRLKGGLFNKDLNTISTFTVAQPSGWPSNNVDYNFPCVEFNEDAEVFLVTWNDGDLSQTPPEYHGNIWGKIYDTSGNVEVDQFMIESGSFVRTDIVPYLSGAFLVSFDGSLNVYGQMVDSDGNILGGEIQLSASPAAKADWANMATDGSNIFVVWEDIRWEYEPSWADDFPDAAGNSHNLNIPTGNEVTYTFGQEKQFISEAQVTSIGIAPENLEKWHQFLEVSTLTITFSILDADNDVIPGFGDISSGQDLSAINPVLYPEIKLRAFFTRNNPTYTPTLDSWTVLYEGIDLIPPVTSVENVDGVKGLNDWYISESVTIWLKAVDYPEDTGSGIDATYYTLDGGSPQMYNDASGIYLVVTIDDDWWNIWEVNFWSVDKEGNVEDRTKPGNYRTIKIDAEPPYVEMTEPANEQKVNTPFWVRADVTENAELDRVEFDIEPFGKRPGLPFKDYTPPWEWECNEDPLSRVLPNIPNNPHPAGVNVMVRAQAYDKSGQTWIVEHWVYIENWNPGSKQKTISNFRSIAESLRLGVAISNKLDINIPTVEDTDSVKFVATKVFTRKQTAIWDNDVSDGYSASFDIPTGFYKITSTTYKEGTEIANDLVSRVLYINR